MGPLSEPVYHSSSESSQKGEQEADIQQPDKKPPLNCPRCKSTNTKFCYYNNYSRLQPRHFCRACRRHWTAGGTLRDVPFGGGRKYTKRRKCQNSFNASSASTTSTSTSDQSFTDTNNTLPFVEPRFMPAYLPPLEYGIGSIFNEITNTNTEPTFMAPSYDAMNLYNEGPTWQLPDIAPAGCWDEINDLV